VTDPRIKDSYADIRDRWTLLELEEALVVLDALDDAAQRARERQEAESARRAR
jgi:hypothetical protein